MKIILTDTNLRKSFDVFNIIKRYIKTNDIIVSGKSSFLFSLLVYQKSNVTLRENSYENFEKYLIKLLKQYSSEDIVYLPVEEDTTLLVYEFIKKNHFQNLKYLLPEFSQFELARNKYSLNEFCISNNIPAPKLFTKSEIITSNSKQFVPVICKPRIGSGAKGIKIVEKYDEISKLSSINESEYVIQELLPDGKDVHGAFFLMNKGELISAYGHKRIRTFPKKGGVTVFSKLDINQEIIETGSLLLKKLNWSGFAMVEFLYDNRDNKYKVIEINPRLWGSVLLSEFCGANFLNGYINIATVGKAEAIKVKNDVKIQWFLFDFLNYLSSEISFKEFFTYKRKDICYINATYSNWWSIFWFHFFFLANAKNLKTFLLKWRKK